MAQPEADLLQVVVGGKQPQDEKSEIESSRVGETAPLIEKQPQNEILDIESCRVGETTPLIDSAEGSLAHSQINLADLGQHYGFRRFHVMLILVGVANSWGISTIMGAGPYLQSKVILEFKSQGIVESQQSLVTTSIALGSMGGVLVGGFFGDRFGRRNCILLFTASLALVGILHLLIPSERFGFVLMVVLRSSLGVFYGALLVLQGTLVSELCGDKWRGAILSLSHVGWSIGNEYVLAWLYYFDNLSWRTTFAFLPLGPLLFAVCCLFMLPESPRWLLVSGQDQRAKKSLDYIFASAVICGKAVVGPAPRVIQTEATVDNTEASFSETLRLLLTPAWRNITIAATLMYTSIAATSNTFWIYGPFIVSKINGKNENDNLPLFARAELTAFPAALVCALAVDSLGRKGLLMMSSLFKAVLFMLLTVPSMTGQLEGVWLSQSFLTAILWTVTAVYTAEVYPTDLRGRGLAFSMFFGRLASVVVPLVVGHLLDLGVAYVLHCAVSMCLLCVICVAVLPVDLAQMQMRDRCLSHKVA